MKQFEASQQIFNVRKFGAAGDGCTMDSEAINTALEQCHRTGGGRVVVPAGTYLCGPIQLRSHVELHLETGACILFSKQFDDFPLCLAYYEGQRTVRCRSPLWGERLENVAITGAGTFDGRGEAWRPVKKFKLSETDWETLTQSGGVIDESRGIWWPTSGAMQGESRLNQLRQRSQEPELQDYIPVRDFLRPNLVQLVNCRNVRLDGPTFQNSPAWNVHLLLCEDVEVRNCTIINPWYATNGDGLDLESCRNVLVDNCTLDVGDDAICLKSGKDAEGRRRGRPCENIVVTNCRVLHGHGGVVVGSEMSGGVRNVRVEDCEFHGTDVGLRFKSCRGRGGVVENIEIRGVKMSAIPEAAISFDLYYSGTAWGEADAPLAKWEPVTEATPQFRDILIENVSCDGARVAVEVRGLPEMPVKNVTITGMVARSQWGIQLQDARAITLHEVNVEVDHLPALSANNVENLRMIGFNGSLHNYLSPQPALSS